MQRNSRPVGRHGHQDSAPATARDAGYSARNTSEPLVPPNPKEFESAVRIVMLRAVFGT
jgi:hypothetical protein